MASKKIKGSKEAKGKRTNNFKVSEESARCLTIQQSFKKSCASVNKKVEDKTYSEVVSEPGSVEHNANCIVNNEISFFSGNPFNEITKGILHIIKDEELAELKTENCSHTVCILSIPTTMTCQDILAFTAACHRDIQHFRILRDGNQNQYMTLIKFRSYAAASEFYKCFNGIPYNSIEPDVVCRLVFVTKVEVIGSALSLTVPTDLSSCPVCLDRMDENVDGILTILCNHTFHFSCLAKWCDTSCPICRYAQTPEPMADSHCMECVVGCGTDGLWICLICGHVGCSRYHEGHAYEHYRDTHHCYAMQLCTNRVWDYIGENFVHRLLQDKDGKMVESDREPTKGEITDVDEKIDSLMLEFTHSLTLQLQTQRQYFEEKLSCYEQRSILEINELRSKLEEAICEGSQIQEKLTLLNREKQIVEKKLQSSNNKILQMQTELAEEKELRKALHSNQTSWEIKHQKLKDEMSEYKKVKELEIRDLQEQVRDLMFFIKAQKEIEQSSEKDEITSGQIVHPKAGPSNVVASSNSKKHRRGKH